MEKDSRYLPEHVQNRHFGFARFKKFLSEQPDLANHLVPQQASELYELRDPEKISAFLIEKFSLSQERAEALVDVIRREEFKILLSKPGIGLSEQFAARFGDDLFNARDYQTVQRILTENIPNAVLKGTLSSKVINICEYRGIPIALDEAELERAGVELGRPDEFAVDSALAFEKKTITDNDTETFAEGSDNQKYLTQAGKVPEEVGATTFYDNKRATLRSSSRPVKENSSTTSAPEKGPEGSTFFVPPTPTQPPKTIFDRGTAVKDLPKKIKHLDDFEAPTDILNRAPKKDKVA